jgi:ABC-type polysaccharide/polyol phosphate transport system ATPase subunit
MPTITKRELAIKITEQLGTEGHSLSQQDVLEVIQRLIIVVADSLAVGDQEFRNRSEARMREMRDRAGTVFLVSHSMKSILDTCTRVIWIEKGELIMDGKPEKVVRAYNKHTGSKTID